MEPLRFRKVSQSQTPERNPSFLADDHLNDNLSVNDPRNLRMAMNEYELTAASFLQNLAQKNNLSLHYSQVPNQIKPFSKEPYIACRFHTIGAESKGKNVLMAKQAASAQVLATLLVKQKNGTLPEEIGYLDLAERELALSLACEHINYEEILNTMVSKLNTNRTPQYSPIFNVPNGQFSYRCKAVGFNGVGTGRTKEIAKRIAAKLVIEKIQEQKEKYLINKYGTKKAKKLIKLY
uniref:DRBM domain-containing protein n=1 Tax=Rhodnius prolixus TaxID=13249 RepID=T1HVN3_RHOPR